MTRPQPRPEGVGEVVGTRRAGELLGVSERTIVRWCDAGRLAVAYWTEGGQRRILEADVRGILEAREASEVPA